MLEACVDEEVAVVPFGGGTSVVGGVEPLRDGREAVISLDLGRIAHVDSRRQALADRRAGRRPARARGRSGARRARADARPLPAVVGVRDRRRLGRDTLGRPGLDRLRRDRQARRRACAASRRAATSRCRRSRRRPPAPGCASSWSGSEGLFGVITEATLKVRPPPAARALRGLDVPRLRGGRGGVPRAGAAPRDPRRRAAVGPGRDAPVDDALRRRLAVSAACGRRYIGARGYDGGCIAILGFEGERGDVDARRAQTERILRRAGGLSLGTGPGPRVEARALRGPVPARRAARPRRDGGDARDGRAVVRA